MLKTLALNHIRGKLGQCDIVELTLSRFTSQYDEIRSICVDQLAADWVEGSTTEATRASVNKKIDSFAGGGLEHTTEILSALWEIVNGDGDIVAPSDTSIDVSPFWFCLIPGVLTSRNQLGQVMESPTHWAAVKVALIKSIRKGVFFDRKHWARYSKGGDVLKPVYFSSVIMDDKSQQLNDCTLEFGCGFADALKAHI